ncbi:hypothetical protein CBR_g1060 [Chara braunii]|uniref:MD-2-related lipid-recognition domain-containing protein n=1 Tax=Chara braunii TaxID=69332 RepID=A0A388KD41_CHABU|nr:hypothetical protein CBR_g1060 [Chara braunii]|eukprot:GBG67941.1 hypothetical protein CBR_g1060 [Chara braunii]
MDGHSFGALLLLLTCLSLSAAQCVMGAATWGPCGEKDVPVTVKGVVVTPDPPVRGSAFSFELPATSNRVITGGYVKVFVFFHGVPVHLEEDDLCEKTSCPVQIGDFVFRNAQDLPGVTPPGPYMVKVSAFDENDEPLFCTKIRFMIVKRPRESGFLKAIL